MRSAPGSDDGTVPVAVEVVALRCADGALAYRVVRTLLPRGEHPDAIARGLVGFEAGEPSGVLHSTSWRCEDGIVVLTYVACPDRSAAPADALVPPLLAQGTPTQPAPPELDMPQVAAHAVRHLAFLAERGEFVECVRAERTLWDAIRGLDPSPAGEATIVATA